MTQLQMPVRAPVGSSDRRASRCHSGALNWNHVPGGIFLSVCVHASPLVFA